MAIKSQIDIDVNSAEFTALRDAFTKYETALKKMPAAWQNVGQASLAAKTNFESVANNMKVVGGTLATITTNSKAFFEVTTATARHWHNLAISTASVAKNIVGATESLLKWSGIISLVTGGAGLFGFDRLAQSVSTQRMAAMGTGGTYGARQAFVTNFRRFGDPESLLSRVAEAQTSFKESVSLRLLGLTNEELKGDPADVAIKALQHGAQIASRDKATGLPVGSDPHLQLFSTAERIRLRDHPEEIEEMVARMRADQKSGRLNLSPADQKGYQDFTTRMEKASREIETIFVKGLVKLAGPLGELSDATVKMVDKFTDKALPAFIADLGGAVDWLAKEVEKPSFVEKVEGIVGMIGSLASSFGGMLSGLGGFARWLGVGTATSPASSWMAGERGVSSLTGPGGETSLEGRHRGHGAGHFRHGAGHGDSGGGGGRPPEGSLKERGLRLMNDLIAKGWTSESAAMAAGNAQSESGISPSGPPGDHNTAFGMFQDRLDRATSLRAYERRHPGDPWTANVEHYDEEAQQQGWKHEHDMSRAGAFSHATEGYGDTTEGVRVRRSNQWLKTYRESHKKVTVQAVPGGNTSLGSGAAAAGSP